MGRTGAQQPRAADAGADRVGVEEESARTLVKEAAAWVRRIRLTAGVGLAGCRGRSRARRRIDDRVIACRALIAPILAPRVAGCTRRRRGVGQQATHRAQARARQISGLSARTITAAHSALHTQACAPARLHACVAWHGYRCAQTCSASLTALWWRSTIEAERRRCCRWRSGGRDGCNRMR